MSSPSLTDEEILKLWKNPLFFGAFAGIRNFGLLLKTDLGYHIPESRLRRILVREPLFLIHQRRPRKFVRRKFYLSALGQTVQADLAHMFSENQFNFFLCVVDCYSNRVLTRALKTKSGPEVSQALKECFKELAVQIHVFETDRYFI